MEHEMKESLPKTWDKTKRVYEISYINGKKEIWRFILVPSCFKVMMGSWVIEDLLFKEENF